MPGHRRPKDGVLSHTYVCRASTPSFLQEDVDGRDKPGHDQLERWVLES